MNPAALLGALADCDVRTAVPLARYTTYGIGGPAALLVEPRNPRAMAAALYTLATDADLRHRVGDAGRELAPEYSWDRVTERVIDYYREVRAAAIASGDVAPR